jgi:peptidoglycan/LPS O-acetylase OafA/YrhL
MDAQLSLDNNKVYFKQLDGLRCIAVMSVLICHWITYPIVVFIPLGSMGVNLFFVLSGFLITRILLMSKDENEGASMLFPIKQFYKRRTLRIFPIYYLTIFFLFFIKLPPAVRENMGWLLTYTFNIKFALPHVWESNQLTYLVHLWSLSVEEQFYIFFPFLIFLIPKKKTKQFFYLLILVGVFSRLVLYIINAPLNSLYVLTPCCFDSFGIGALLAYYILYDPEFLKRVLNRNYLFLIFVLIFIIDIVYSRMYIKGYGECRTILERFLFSACCFWIVGKGATNAYSGYFKKFLMNPFVIYMGKISYGIYIYHYFAAPFIDIGLNLTHKQYLAAWLWGHMVIRAGILFVATLVVASLSWYFIEMPINALKDKFAYKVKYKLV